MHELKIRDVMTTHPFCLPVSATVGEALEAARERDLHHVMMKRGERFVGVVCVCTLRALDPKVSLSSCLPTRTHAVQGESPLWIARRRFDVDGVHCLPVFEGDELVGVVTQGDLRRRAPVAARMDAEPPVCSVCGATRHVRPDASGENRCLDCTEPSHAPL